jgi:hypothetical protein
MKDTRERVTIPNKIPDGVPGAGLVLAILVIFSFFMLTADIEGCTFGFGNQRTAAPAPSRHATTGAGGHMH